MTLLFEPISVNSLTLRNRIVMPPMAMNLADEEGKVTDQLIQHYQRFAVAELGIIIIEHAYVHKSGQLTRGQLAVDCDACIEGLSRLVNTVHKAGGRVGLQLTHAGAAAKEEITGQPPVGPSAVMRPGSSARPRALESQEIRNLAQAFAAAARRAQLAGFDMVELHGAHGYLINQFNSPLTNQRRDSYGGTLENRFRFLLEVTRAVRRAIGPQMQLWLRLGVQDNYPQGLTLEESCRMASQLVKCGIDCLDISAGLGGIHRSGDTSPGFLAPWSREIKQSVSVPVVVTGGIKDGITAEAILKRGDADLIGIGRALLADPTWPAKAKAALSQHE